MKIFTRGFGTSDRDDWLPVLREIGVGVAPVNHVEDLLNDEHVAAEGYLVTLDNGLTFVKSPIGVDEIPLHGAPEHGRAHLRDPGRAGLRRRADRRALRRRRGGLSGPRRRAGGPVLAGPVTAAQLPLRRAPLPGGAAGPARLGRLRRRRRPGHDQPADPRGGEPRGHRDPARARSIASSLPLDVPYPALAPREPYRTASSARRATCRTTCWTTSTRRPPASGTACGTSGAREFGFYNGVGDGDAGPGGHRLGIEAWARHGIVGRGVLADVAGYLAARGTPLDPRREFAITASLLAEVLAAPGHRSCWAATSCWSAPDSSAPT